MSSSLLQQLVTIHSWQRVTGATTTIFVTAISDAIWLIPFCVHPSNRVIGLFHGIIYITSFTILVTLINVITIVVYNFTVQREEDAEERSIGTTNTTTTNNNDETNRSYDTNKSREIIEERISFISSIVGASLCWTIAAYFYYKSWVKNRKQDLSSFNDTSNVSCELISYTALPLVDTDTENTPSNLERQSSDVERSEDKSNDQGGTVCQGESSAIDKDQFVVNVNDVIAPGTTLDQSGTTTPMSTVHLWTVVSLTMLGTLDEVSYFPSLILGNIFSPAEMIIGAMLATTLIVIVITCFIDQCKPLLHWLDKVPTYMIIAVFASMLSLEVLWDLITDSD